MGMGNRFEELTLPLIEGGDFLRDLNVAIAKAQAALVGHVDKHGELSAKAKAKVKVEVVFEVENPEAGTFTIKPKLSVELPGRPCRATAAFANETVDEETGEVAFSMFVRGSGSTPGDPTQMHLPIDVSIEDEEPTKKAGKKAGKE